MISVTDNLKRKTIIQFTHSQKKKKLYYSMQLRLTQYHILLWCTHLPTESVSLWFGSCYRTRSAGLSTSTMENVTPESDKPLIVVSLPFSRRPIVKFSLTSLDFLT